MAGSLGIGGAWKNALTARRIVAFRSAKERPFRGAKGDSCRLRPRPPTLRSVLSLLLTAGMVLLSGLHGRVARGQDDWDVGKKAVDRPNQQGRIVLPDFDQWVLRGKTRDQLERVLKSQLALQVDSVDRACALSGAQREKLQLAGDGDLKRLSRTIEQLREKFREVGQDQEKFQTIAGEALTLQMKMQSGVYDESSLFQKVLRQTLSREQSARYEQQERERRKFRYEGKIELVVANLETASRSAPISGSGWSSSSSTKRNRPRSSASTISTSSFTMRASWGRRS